MTDDANITSLAKRIEGYFKAILSFGGVIYATGFLVVSVHLSRYDISPFGVIRIQYILAGAWLILPLVLTLCIAFWVLAYAYHLFKKSTEQRRSRWRLVWVPVKILIIVLGVYGICSFFLNLLCSSAPVLAGKFQHVRFGDFLKLGGFCLGIFLFSTITWAFLSDIRTKKGEISYRDLFAGISYVAITSLVFAGYMGFFAINLYPSIPADLGGGSSIEMRVMLKKNDQNVHINKLLGITDDTVLSPSLKLLLVTDKSYFIADPNVDRISIELPKDMVSVAAFGSHK
jgi:uncharacterized membrane protein YwzB